MARDIARTSHRRQTRLHGRHVSSQAGATTTRRFAAFDNRNFRLYFIGQTISSIGSWSQSLAVIWLVLEITNRSDRLGIATALQFLPMLLLGAPAGVLADKFDNRRLLVATSAVSGLLALTFGVVVATGHVTIWWIYALTMMLGLVLAVERPTMQAILFQLVGPDLLPSAVAANSTINSVSRLIGPAIAGAPHRHRRRRDRLLHQRRLVPRRHRRADCSAVERVRGPAAHRAGEGQAA